MSNDSPNSMWEERNDGLMLPFFGIQFYSSLLKACDKIGTNVAESINQFVGSFHSFSRRKRRCLLKIQNYFASEEL